MTPDERKVAESYVEALRSTHRSLTKWEIDFVDSIEDQLGEGRHLSEKQMEVLERIYAEKM